MYKEIIKESANSISVSLFDAGQHIKTAVFCLEVLTKVPDHKKHLERLRKATGLINKVNRDLNRLI